MYNDGHSIPIQTMGKDFVSRMCLPVLVCCCSREPCRWKATIASVGMVAQCVHMITSRFAGCQTVYYKGITSTPPTGQEAKFAGAYTKLHNFTRRSYVHSSLRRTLTANRVVLERDMAVNRMTKHTPDFGLHGLLVNLQNSTTAPSSPPYGWRKHIQT